MRIITGNILDVTEGVIIHQVNCRNRIGAGVAGALIRKYPAVERAYHESFLHETADSIYGMCLTVRVTPTLRVVNSYSQKDYGNPKRTGRVYTNLDYLVHNIEQTIAAYPDEKIYVPYGIGCGLGGETWERLESRIRDLDVTVVQLP